MGRWKRVEAIVITVLTLAAIAAMLVELKNVLSSLLG